ncbi:hypothetical protein, partial [Pseudomonas lundensis]|uniref:hypothetical protein n=1 Tax=Pseudomonas lundensis TaxID=86185 RepID=UPI001C550DA3
REPDLNRRPSGYEPDELPDCSIPRLWGALYSDELRSQPLMHKCRQLDEMLPVVCVNQTRERNE